MTKLKLFNGVMGKTLMDANVDEEASSEIENLMDMNIDEALAYVNKMFDELPSTFRKLKLSTLFDLFLHMDDEETQAELEKLCEE